MILCLLTADDYGITWDEKVQREYGLLAWRYFVTAGKNTDCNHYLNLRWYTPALETGMHAVSELVEPFLLPNFPTEAAAEYYVRHVINSMVGVSTLFATALIAYEAAVASRQLDQCWLPAAAAIILSTTPRFYGHFFANTKDIPFAAGFTWSVYAILRSLRIVRQRVSRNTDQTLRAKQVFPLGMSGVAGLALGLTTSLRAAGLLVVPVVSVSVAGTIIVGYRALAPSQRRVGIILWAGGRWLVVCLVSIWMGMVLLWPAAHAKPLTHPVNTLMESVNFSTVVRMRFEGADVWSDKLPRHYYLRLFAITTPLVTVGTGAIGLANSLRKVACWLASTDSQHYDDVSVQLVLALWVLVPFAVFIIHPLNVYDGIRHFLFVLPPIAILAAHTVVTTCTTARTLKARNEIAAAPTAVTSLISPRLAFLLLAGPGISILHMVNLHPYQTSYFNELVGGVGTVSVEPPDYDTDYWASCYREASLWAVEQAKMRRPSSAGSPKVLAAANSFSRECIHPYLPPHWQLDTSLDPTAPRVPAKYDFYIASTRWSMHHLYPESTVVHRIQRAGATFCLIKSDQQYLQAVASSEPRAQTVGAAAHPLLKLDTIRDAGQHRQAKQTADATFTPEELSSANGTLHTNMFHFDADSREPYDYAESLSSTTADNTADIASLVAQGAEAQNAATGQPATTSDLASDAEPTLRRKAAEQDAGKFSEKAMAARDMNIKLPSGSVTDKTSAMYKFALANKLRDLGRAQEAVKAFEDSVAHETILFQRGAASSPAPFNNFGSLLEDLGLYERAIMVYSQAVKLHPTFGLGFFNLGSRLSLMYGPSGSLVSRDGMLKAVSFLNQAVELMPGYHPGWSNLGDSLKLLGQIEESITCYQRALLIEPTYAVALNNLGNVLKSTARIDEAIEQYELAVQSSISAGQGNGYGSAAMWVNLGSAYMEQDRLVEALLAFQNASQAEPEYAPAYSNMGRIYEDQGAIDVARHNYQQAYELEKSDALAMSMALLLPAVMPANVWQLELNLMHAVAYLDGVLASTERVTKAGPLCATIQDQASDCPSLPQFRDPINDFGSMGFYLSYYGLNLREFKQKLAAVATLGAPSLEYTAPHLASWRPPTHTGVSSSGQAGRHISIGFVSRNFYDHSTGKWMLGLVKTLTRPIHNVTVVMLPPQKDDATARLFVAAADQILKLTSDSLSECRNAIAALQLDVLIYADIGMDAISYALGFSRLAAIQATTGPAWPVTTGIPAIDYFITFDAEMTGAEQHYTEQLLRLPGILPYAQPIESGSALVQLRQIHHHDRQLASLRAEFGLPGPSSGKVVYLCIQAPYKFHPEFDHAIGQLLAAVPAGIFVMLRGKARHWTDTLLTRLQMTLGPEMLRRVRVLPRTPSHRMPQLLACADVVLDTWPYGGGITSLETLTLGRPLVTLAHPLLPGRFTFAFYRQMELLDSAVVAFTPTEYVRAAVLLGTNLSARTRLSERVLARVGRLFDDTVARAALEVKLQAMLDEFRNQSHGY